MIRKVTYQKYTNDTLVFGQWSTGCPLLVYRSSIVLPPFFHQWRNKRGTNEEQQQNNGGTTKDKRPFIIIINLKLFGWYYEP